MSLVWRIGFYFRILIQSFINHYEKYGFTAYAVESKSNGEFIGFVGPCLLRYVAWATGGTSCNLGLGLKAKEHIYNSLDQ